jgi:chromosomal replication initiator protein
MTRNRSASRQLEIISTPQSHQLDLLSFVSEELGLSSIVEREKPTRSRSVAGPKFHGHIDLNKTFSNLILGDSNHFVVEATKRFIVQEKSDYGMIYLNAESGLGKSHILNAAANELMTNKKSFYIGSPFSMTTMLENLTLFKEYEFLLIDDVEEVCGNKDIQNKFCKLFDFAQMGKMKIIISGRVAPRELKNCETRFKGKLSAGLIQVIKKLDQNLAFDIVESKCKSIQLDLPVEVCKRVTENVEFNVYGIESTLHKLKNISERANVLVTMDLIENEFPDSKLVKKKVEITKEIQKVLDRVALSYNVNATDLFERNRYEKFVLARHVAMYILRENLKLSYTKIAEIFNRDHSSVMYGIDRIRKKLSNDPKFLKQLGV